MIQLPLPERVLGEFGFIFRFCHGFSLTCINLAQGRLVTISAAFSLCFSQRSTFHSSLITLLNISRRQKMNFGWAMIYSVTLIDRS